MECPSDYTASLLCGPHIVVLNLISVFLWFSGILNDFKKRWNPSKCSPWNNNKCLVYFWKRDWRTIVEIWWLYLPDDIIACVFRYLFVPLEIQLGRLCLFLSVPWVNSLQVTQPCASLALLQCPYCLGSVGTITRQCSIPCDSPGTRQAFDLRNSLAFKMLQGADPVGTDMLEEDGLLSPLCSF